MMVDGRTAPTEQVWEGWPGYAHSGPVRSGNEEAEQHRLDGYGWIVDAAWQYHRVRGHISRETWRLVRQLTDFVAGHWREPDAGMREERREPRHYGHSELMAYLALDRAIELDAALPLLPVIRFDPPDSPRVRGTIDAVRRDLSADGALLYRASGYGDIEGAFLPCSFWIVQALAATGRRQEALDLLEELASHASPAGLLPEEIDPATGHHLGNTPMLCTHAALIQAAMALAAANDGDGHADRNSPSDAP